MRPCTPAGAGMSHKHPNIVDNITSLSQAQPWDDHVEVLLTQWANEAQQRSSVCHLPELRPPGSAIASLGLARIHRPGSMLSKSFPRAGARESRRDVQNPPCLLRAPARACLLPDGAAVHAIRVERLGAPLSPVLAHCMVVCASPRALVSCEPVCRTADHAVSLHKETAGRRVLVPSSPTDRAPPCSADAMDRNVDLPHLRRRSGQHATPAHITTPRSTPHHH